MKGTIFQIFALSAILIITYSFSVAQKKIVPIVELGNRGLLGGVQNGKWLTPAQLGKIAQTDTEYVIAGWKGVEGGGLSWAKRGKIQNGCRNFYRMNFELEAESGIAIGSEAKWNPVPRIPQEINLKNPNYQKIVKDFLKTRGIYKPNLHITKALQIDLDGDGKAEVVISATNYSRPLHDFAKKNEYSFVMVRKLVGKTAQSILLAGDFITSGNFHGKQTFYEISSIADLNGDGKMEIIINGIHFEGDLADVFETKGNHFVKVNTLSVKCNYQ